MLVFSFPCGKHSGKIFTLSRLTEFSGVINNKYIYQSWDADILVDKGPHTHTELSGKLSFYHSGEMPARQRVSTLCLNEFNLPPASPPSPFTFFPPESVHQLLFFLDFNSFFALLLWEKSCRWWKSSCWTASFIYDTARETTEWHNKKPIKNSWSSLFSFRF